MQIFGIAGWKNSGKTTLVAALVREFGARGLRVSTIKHAHHAFDLDLPGKDSFLHREAGAQEVLISSHGRWALLHELRGAGEPPLADLLQRMSRVDLVLIEGFKDAAHPKLEVRRKASAGQKLTDTDPYIVAIATDGVMAEEGRPVFALDDVLAIADFIQQHCGLDSAE
ncbi:MAG: molybdopterin-guanine dinucleotide biosynthesis protein B [Alphaproteobacteria bacterium]|nr:molybdopterin-guanine dinucleotide biosynthesis protein B [Alphaproteobacteria bacterium]